MSTGAPMVLGIVPPILVRLIARCSKCSREVRFKAEGPPYFSKWKYLPDDDEIAGWLIPNADEGTHGEALVCPDHRGTP